MLLALGVGFGATLIIGVLIILPLWWRNRKMPNFTPDQSLISKAMDMQYGRSQWRHEHYVRH